MRLECHAYAARSMKEKGFVCNAQKTLPNQALPRFWQHTEPHCLDHARTIFLFPLLAAARKGHASCVKILINARANLKRVGEHRGDFPLLQDGHVECVRHLIDAKVDANQVNKKGEFPLLMAEQHEHVECVQLLLKAGATRESHPLAPCARGESGRSFPEVKPRHSFAAASVAEVAEAF